MAHIQNIGTWTVSGAWCMINTKWYLNAVVNTELSKLVRRRVTGAFKTTTRGILNSFNLVPIFHSSAVTREGLCQSVCSNAAVLAAALQWEFLQIPAITASSSAISSSNSFARSWPVGGNSFCAKRIYFLDCNGADLIIGNTSTMPGIFIRGNATVEYPHCFQFGEIME